MDAAQTMTMEGDQITALRSTFQTLASIRHVGLAGFPNDYADLPVSLEDVMTINTLRRPVPELDGFAFLE